MGAVSEIVKAISEEANWSAPDLDEKGKASFALEDGLVFEIYSPDAETLIFRAPLGDLPTSEQDTDHACREGARLMAASFLSRHGVLSLEDGQFCLHDRLHLKQISTQEAVRFCAQFLNECDWWRAQFSKYSSPAEEQFWPGAGLRL